MVEGKLMSSGVSGAESEIAGGTMATRSSNSCGRGGWRSWVSGSDPQMAVRNDEGRAYLCIKQAHLVGSQVFRLRPQEARDCESLPAGLSTGPSHQGPSRAFNLPSQTNAYAGAAYHPSPNAVLRNKKAQRLNTLPDHPNSDTTTSAGQTARTVSAPPHHAQRLPRLTDRRASLSGLCAGR